MPTDDERTDLPAEVHVEREKTKRTLIVASAITIVGTLATLLFFNNIDDRGGTLKVTDKGVEVTLDRPITDQLGTTTENVSAFGDSVALTTGTISTDDIRHLPAAPSNGEFAGRNFIDTTSGFVLSSDRPQTWKIDTVQGAQRFSANDGSTITVRVTEGASTADLERVFHRTLDSLRTAGVRAMSRVDSTSTTAMVWYRDPATQETVCVKYSVANDRIYAAKATTKDPASVTSVVQTISGFTPITKVAPSKLRVPSVRGNTLRQR